MSWRAAPLTASTLAARCGQLHNTLIIYVHGDNGASAEGGLNGTLNEWADNNGIHETPEAILERIHRRDSHHHGYRRPKPQRRLSQAATVKLRRYRKSLDMLGQATLDSQVVDLRRFEVEALEALRPDTPAANAIGLGN